MTLPVTSSAIDVPGPGGWRQQFARPTGALGQLAGHLMAFRNKERSWWVLPLLEIHDKDRVLEVGFGSGADIRRVSEIAVHGFVAGIDHSEVIRAGRVELQLGSASRLPYPDASFDKAFCISVAQSWPDPLTPIQELCRVLREGGRIAIALQPGSEGASERTARDTGKMLTENLKSAGFSQVRLESKKLKPVSVVCAVGVK
jgi:SAM-dependent methyltransferase